MLCPETCEIIYSRACKISKQQSEKEFWICQFGKKFVSLRNINLDYLFYLTSKLMTIFVFRNQIFLGFQRTEGLFATGRTSLYLPEDRQLVHSQSGSVGRRELHMRSEKHDDQCHSFQLADACGGAEGR